MGLGTLLLPPSHPLINGLIWDVSDLSHFENIGNSFGNSLSRGFRHMAPGKHDANGHRGVSCLQWDDKTETFIEQCLQCLRRQKSQGWQGLDDIDDEEPMSA
jgi:hypothetical protein